ncbi:hypothetical protein EVAR_23336_1 [Eumeta japonica]|uniref:Uncharacterized protein n=1 Tax=Eumeta variegata TaxID=151549 RepID=A0A4C1Y1A1_EUMVA|nr:hypothetical protein EVAR_23336_1 [Eumeta japonica]
MRDVYRKSRLLESVILVLAVSVAGLSRGPGGSSRGASGRRPWCRDRKSSAVLHFTRRPAGLGHGQGRAPPAGVRAGAAAVADFRDASISAIDAKRCPVRHNDAASAVTSERRSCRRSTCMKDFDGQLQTRPAPALTPRICRHVVRVRVFSVRGGELIPWEGNVS